MRAITLLSLLCLSILNVSANDETYNAYKTMIISSTETRVKAMNRNDFDKVCNAIGSTAGTDTMVYYLAFEMLENEDFSAKLSDDVGYFYFRNFESIHKKDLPQELHGACVNDNKKEIKKIMNTISSILAQE